MEEMKKLIRQLNKASESYYKYDKPIMSDKSYDLLYDKLAALEKSTGIIMSNSPTQRVQGEILVGLTKVKHSKPMLSAQKTKNIEDINRFIGNEKVVVSWKEDGLTIVLRYKNGLLKQALTRGTGDFGEDVTHTVKMFSNVPMKLKYCVDLEVRGEGLISWDSFKEINEVLENQYSHPRNLASGSTRQLDSNVIKIRNLEFKAFELVQENMDEYDFYNQGMDKFESLEYLSRCGFDVVEHRLITKDEVEDVIKEMNPDNYRFPVDGLIFEINDKMKAKRLGSTQHHENKIIALKWADETYETKLINIEWNTSRTGLINPVAIFEPVDLGGAVTTRATLHNISYIEDLQLGIGDVITVYRANMVIPKIDDNLTRSNTWMLPDKCPNCGSEVESRNENGSKTLHCINPNCSAKLLGKLSHFVSKNAMNIEGLSEMQLEKFINLGWIEQFEDIFKLTMRKEIVSLDGFGKKSFEKLRDAIQSSKKTTLNRLIYSLSIPYVGRDASKRISQKCKSDFESFKYLINNRYDWTEVEGIGDVINKSIQDYFGDLDNKYWFDRLVGNWITIETETENSLSRGDKLLDGITFVITGSVHHYKNRDELKGLIESMNGKVVGSVSTKTNYLINNDSKSSSGKNKKAKEVGVPIITEEEFLKIIKQT